MVTSPSYLKQLRDKAGLTQDYVAQRIGVSRPTYLQLEKGKGELSLTQAEKLAQLYGISLAELAEQVTADYEKYKEMIIAFLRAHGPAPKTKLAKLLYLADFAWYYTHLSSMSGMPYRKLQYGPVPDAYFRALDELESEGKVCIDRASMSGKDVFTVSESTSNTRARLGTVTPEEGALIDSISKKWKGKKTAEIVNFTHNQLPYSISRPGEVIPYLLITQEDTENVY